MPRHEIVFCWFASVYASVAVLAARFLGKRTIIVVGGVDVAGDRQLNYGIFLSPWRAPLVRYALRNADRVLVVDESLRHEAKARSEYRGENIECVPTGYDASFWTPKGTKRQEILCVTVVLEKGRVQLKGVDTFIEAARKMPKTKFILIGVRGQAVEHLHLPENIQIIQPIDRAELLPYYRRAKVYCQPSRREGLPNTLCEAMLCECIPVATNVGGVGNAVGDAGFLVRPGDSEALVAALQQALKTSARMAQRARSRVSSLFPRKKREETLMKIVSELTA